MLIAALDTATLTLSCALCEIEGSEVSLVAERLEHAPARPGPQGPTGGHGGRLPGALGDLLTATDRKLPEIEGYAVGLGPGSFTGLRIGLATWKGLAYANRRPISGGSSLAAMALAAATSAEPGALLVPLLDARKGEVYAGFYKASSGGVEAVEAEVVLPPSGLLRRLDELERSGSRPVAFGEGLRAYGEELAGLRSSTLELTTPPALSVARLCAAELLRAQYDPARLFSLEPHYVRPSEAELKFPNGLGSRGSR